MAVDEIGREDRDRWKMGEDAETMTDHERPALGKPEMVTAR